MPSYAHWPIASMVLRSLIFLAPGQMREDILTVNKKNLSTKVCNATKAVLGSREENGQLGVLAPSLQGSKDYTFDNFNRPFAKSKSWKDLSPKVFGAINAVLGFSEENVQLGFLSPLVW